MRNLQELFNDVNFDKENLNINESLMSKEEKDKILELALNKAGLKNKSTKKRLILPFAAVFALIFSFAAVFAQGGLSNIYYNLFGENTKYVNEMGTVINESYSSNGITFNVANMLGDEHSFYIIFEIVKENGESFENSDYIQFDNLKLDFKSSGGYSWYQVDDDNASDNKATFILAGNTKKKIIGDKLKFAASDISEYSIIEPTNGFNPYDFLLNHREYINQGLTENYKKSVAPSTENNLPEEQLNKINAIHNLTPNYVLPWKYSNIFVERNFDEMYIDNVGFAEDKLCMRLAIMNSEYNSIGDIYFINKNNPNDIVYNEFIFTEQKDGVTYEYYVFDIENMEELKGYDFKYNVVSKINTIEGNWEVKFKADYKNTAETINIYKEAVINGKRYIVKNIKISPIAVNVEMDNNLLDNVEDPVHDFNESVSIIMKDGSTIELSGGGSSTNALSSSINLMFKKPIDTAEIQKIKIGTIEYKFN